VLGVFVGSDQIYCFYKIFIEVRWVPVFELNSTSMASHNSKQDHIRLLVARKKRNLRLADLKILVGHDESVISKAINYGRYPNVVRKLKEVLDV